MCPKTRGPSHHHLDRCCVRFHEVTFKERQDEFWRSPEPDWRVWTLPEDALCVDLPATDLLGLPHVGVCLHRGRAPSPVQIHLATGRRWRPYAGLQLKHCSWESCTSVQDGPLSQLNHSLPITEHSSASNGCTGGWEFSKEVFLSTIVTEVSANLKTSQLYNRMWLFCDVTCTALLFLVLSELVMHCGLDVLGADCIENFWPPVVKASQTDSLKWCSS